MSLGLATTFRNTFYTDVVPTSGGPSGSATSALVPNVFDVAVGGHAYMLDLGGENAQTGFRHESIPTLRPVFIEGDSLGEKDINPESLWRFSDRDWSHGSGQRFADMPTSDTSMFWQSKGIDCWTEWQISLLPDTMQIWGTDNTNLECLQVGSYLYLVDGIQVLYTTDMVSFTAVTGLPGEGVTAICTDGYDVWIAVTANGVYTTTRGASAATAYITDGSTLTSLAYVNGRLMASAGQSIYNIITSGSLPTPLFTSSDVDFEWVGFVEGQQAIYVGGSSPQHNEIYQIGIASDGTSLTVPILAAPDLIAGELLLSLGSYLGFVFLGTDQGVRLCIADSSGNLSVGSLLQTGPCRCFVGFDRFMWFGWDLYDTESTGLGRMDLSVESSSGAPAFASDLMVSVQSPVLSMDSFNGQRVFAVSGAGFYTESPNLVPSGFLDSGLITYDIPDAKIALYLTVRTVSPLVGIEQAWISVDQGAFQFLGQHDSTTTDDTYTIPELQGFTLEIRELLIRDTEFTTLGPAITRDMLQILPAVNSGYFMYVPLFLVEQGQTSNGGEYSMDVVAERSYLYALHDSQSRIIYQELSTSFPVTVDDLIWTPTHVTQDRSGYNGTLQLKLKTI